MGETQESNKEDLRFIAITNAPADEVGVKTTTKVVLNYLRKFGKCGWMCRMLDCVENYCAVTMRQVQLAWSARCNVVCNNFANFVSKGLN